MLNEFLKKNITSQAGFIQANGYGYGQVEPNHLSGQATKEVYAQLPADKNIEILENGQFAKYNYAKEVVDFDGPGEWMLVFNEIKLYRDHQVDAEFAMLKDNYQARVYSPFGGDRDGNPDIAWTKQSRYYNGQGVDAKDGSITFDNENGTVTVGDKTWPIDDVTAGPDYYEPHYNEDPFHIASLAKEKLMPENGSSMVPRLIKTHVGDIFTTNMIEDEEVALEDELSPNDKGILSTSGDGSIVWQVVKIYTMPDHQPGVKLMRIK
jgi:hypothetical protein